MKLDICLNEFKSLFEGEPDDLRDVSEVFCAHANELIQQLESFYQNQDQYMYLKLLHQLKGCIGYIYLPAIVLEIRNIENILESSSIRAIEQDHIKLKQTISVLVSKIESEILSDS